MIETDDYDETDYSIQSYAYTISYDTRDIKFNPLNGLHYVATIENSFRFKSNSLKFTKYDVNLSNFFKHLKSKQSPHV